MHGHLCSGCGTLSNQLTGVFTLYARNTGWQGLAGCVGHVAALSAQCLFEPMLSNVAKSSMEQLEAGL